MQPLDYCLIMSCSSVNSEIYMYDHNVTEETARLKFASLMHAAEVAKEPRFIVLIKNNTVVSLYDNGVPDTNFFRRLVMDGNLRHYQYEYENGAVYDVVIENRELTVRVDNTKLIGRLSRALG